MNIRKFSVGNKNVIEIISSRIVIKNTQDVLDLFGEQPADAYILYDHNFLPSFFDLSTRELGEILQKCANYHVDVAIIGNFGKYPSHTLIEFIQESNRVGHYVFMSSIEEVKKRWSI